MTDHKHNIKYSQITDPGDDSQNFPTAQITYLGKTANTALMSPYGFGGVAPAGSLCATFCVSGYEENRISMAMLPGSRPKNLKVGEVYMSNFLTGTYIIQRENGDIDVVSKGGQNVTIKNNKTESIQGNLNVTVQGNVDLTVNGVTHLNCNEIHLGTGGQPIARLGDQVEVDTGTGIGTITSASTQNTSA